MSRTVERVELPDGTFMDGPLLGAQMPRLWNVPERHEQHGAIRRIALVDRGQQWNRSLSAVGDSVAHQGDRLFSRFALRTFLRLEHSVQHSWNLGRAG